MSRIAFALAERRIAIFILRPLSVSFGAATFVSAHRGAWWAAGIFLLLVIYMGWLVTNLENNRGKSFNELRRGIALPAISMNESEDLSDEETRHLVGTMVHVLYAVIISVVVAMLIAGTRFYWILLIGVLVWLLGQGIVGVVVALISSPKLFRRQCGK